MSIKYFLFDLDGTLTDPKEGITKCVQYALDFYGIHVEDTDELLPFIGPPLIDSFKMFYGFSHERAVEAVCRYRERFASVGLFENYPYEGMGALLGDLKERGKKLAVATSKPEVFAKRILDKFELSQYFDCVTGSELSGERSEKHEVIEETLKRLGVTDRGSCIMIGDRKYDIIGAKKCGLKTVGVRYGYAEDGELEESGADYICDTVEELHKLLMTL